MDRGAWWATGHGGHKVFDTTEVTENACKGKREELVFYSFPFLRTKGIKRTVSRPENS